MYNMYTLTIHNSMRLGDSLKRHYINLSTSVNNTHTYAILVSTTAFYLPTSHTHTADPIPPSPSPRRRPSTAHHDDDARDDDENVDEIARGKPRARSRGQAIDRTVRRPSTASARPDRVTGHRHSFARANAHRIRIAGSYLERDRAMSDRSSRTRREGRWVGRDVM